MNDPRILGEADLENFRMNKDIWEFNVFTLCGGIISHLGGDDKICEMLKGLKPGDDTEAVENRMFTYYCILGDELKSRLNKVKTMSVRVVNEDGTF